MPPDNDQEIVFQILSTLRLNQFDVTSNLNTAHNPPASAQKVSYTAAIEDDDHQKGKLKDLYESICEKKRSFGADPQPPIK